MTSRMSAPPTFRPVSRLTVVVRSGAAATALAPSWAAGGGAGVARPGAAAGVEVHLGFEVLVTTDEGAVAAVGVEPQCRLGRRVGVPGVARQHRLVESQPGGGLDTVVGQQSPARGFG